MGSLEEQINTEEPEINEALASKNIYEVAIVTEQGCHINEGEYTICISKIINGSVGEYDFGLIEECISEDLDNLKLPEEGVTKLILEETGEREDVFWHKYYKIKEQLS